jgi:hypothetical protein
MSSSEEEDKKPKIQKDLSSNYIEKKKVITTANQDEPCVIGLTKTNKFAIKLKEINSYDQEKFMIGFFSKDLKNDIKSLPKSCYAYFVLMNATFSGNNEEPNKLKKSYTYKPKDVLGKIKN